MHLQIVYDTTYAGYNGNPLYKVLCDLGRGKLAALEEVVMAKNEVHVNKDYNHPGKAPHVDITVPVSNIGFPNAGDGGAYKIEIGPKAEIREEFWVGKQKTEL